MSTAVIPRRLATVAMAQTRMVLSSSSTARARFSMAMMMSLFMVWPPTLRGPIGSPANMRASDATARSNVEVEPLHEQ